MSWKGKPTAVKPAPSISTMNPLPAAKKQVAVLETIYLWDIEKTN
jgi:hypothetical protein